MRAALFLAVATFVACGSATPPPAPAPKPVAPAPVAKPVALTGIWLGALKTGSAELRVQIRLDFATTPTSCVLDSLDQGAMGVPCTNVVASATEVSLEVPLVKGVFKAAIASDATTLNGTWSQAGRPELPLVLARQATALEAKKPSFDPALPAVDVEKLEVVLDEDLKKALTIQLAPKTGVGVTIGVVELCA